MSTDPKRHSWLDTLSRPRSRPPITPARIRTALTQLDAALFAIWGLGENVLLAWTRSDGELLVLSVRHYAVVEALHGTYGEDADGSNSDDPLDNLLAGPKYLSPERFARVCRALACTPTRLRADFELGTDVSIEMVSELLRRYSVSLVRGRAVMLLDAVEFSLQPALDQVAMLNSLSYSINSAYRQLLSKDIDVNFARTTTGDGFYIWNRDIGTDANIALYKLMMMILADNAVAQRKASGPWVPRLRAAFHVGDHYEFHQVEGLNPTTFSYIVGQVTVDLSRMVDKALPGQILLGDFCVNGVVREQPMDTIDFVEQTALAVEQLNGLDVSGASIEKIRCYLTGKSHGGGRYTVNRYYIRDKHGTVRNVYNAKINIHREGSDPIYLGIQRDDMWAFSASRIEEVMRDSEATGSFFIRP